MQKVRKRAYKKFDKIIEIDGFKVSIKKEVIVIENENLVVKINLKDVAFKKDLYKTNGKYFYVKNEYYNEFENFIRKLAKNIIRMIK
jgi:hypothetical protein